MVPFCSLPGEALTPLLQAPAGQEHQLSLHAKWPKSPVPSLGFPGRRPVVKLKINISLASSIACPTLDNSCRGLMSPWRCNPSIKMTTFGPRHPERCRMDKKQSLAQFFLIPAYHLRDHSSVLLCQDPLDRRVTKVQRDKHRQGQKPVPASCHSAGLDTHTGFFCPGSRANRGSFPESPIACLPCQQLPPAQAEPPEPWDVPALARTTVTASCSSSSLLLPGPAQGVSPAPRSCSLCTQRISAPTLSKGSFAFHVESSSQH